MVCARQVPSGWAASPSPRHLLTVPQSVAKAGAQVSLPDGRQEASGSGRRPHPHRDLELRPPRRVQGSGPGPCMQLAPRCACAAAGTRDKPGPAASTLGIPRESLRQGRPPPPAARGHASCWARSLPPPGQPSVYGRLLWGWHSSLRRKQVSTGCPDSVTAWVRGHGLHPQGVANPDTSSLWHIRVAHRPVRTDHAEGTLP